MTKKRTSLAKSALTILSLMVLAIQMAFPVQGLSSSRTLNVPQIKQSKSNWCWAATGASVVSYLKSSCTQSAFYATVKGNTSGNEVADENEIRSGLSAYGLSSSCRMDSVDIFLIMSNIDAGKPMLAKRVAGFKGGHSLEICGYSYYDNQDTALIVYMEPSDGSIYYKSYSLFLSEGDDILSSTTWESTIYNIS